MRQFSENESSMYDFFGEAPLLTQAIPNIEKGIVLAINRIGQVILVLAGFLSIYQDNILYVAKQTLRIGSMILKELCHGAGWKWYDDEIIIGDHDGYATNAQVYSDANPMAQFILSSIVLVVLLATTGRGPLGWIAFPFEFFWGSVSAWKTTAWAAFPVIALLGKIAGSLFVLPIILFFSLLSCAIVVRPYASLMSITSKYMSVVHYRILNFGILLIGAILVLIAT